MTLAQAADAAPPGTAFSQVDGYVAYANFNGPIYTIGATMTVAPNGVADWVAIEQGVPVGAAQFVQAGTVNGYCFWSSDLVGYAIQPAPGPNPSDCAPGHLVTVILYASTGSGASVLFIDDTTGVEWAVHNIPVGSGAEEEAQWLVETNPSLGPAPNPFPAFSFSNAWVTVDNYLFEPGSQGISLWGFAYYGLAANYNSIIASSTSTSPVDPSSSFVVS